MTSALPSPCASPRLIDWRQSLPSNRMPMEQDLYAYQGDGFAQMVEVLNIDGTPFDLTDYTAAAQIRHGPADVFDEIIASFTLTVLPPNQIAMSLPPEQTLAMTGDNYFYDLEIKASDGIPLTIVRGKFFVTLEITRQGVGL